MIARWLFSLVIGWQVFAAEGEWMKFPAHERTVLPNGITLLLMEKHEAPLISLSLALRTGTTQDPAEKEGLAEMTNELLRKGAGSRGAQEIAEELDFIGAELQTSTSLEMTRVQLGFLAKDLSKGMDIFSDLVLRPKFPTNEVDKILNQQVDQIRAAKDQPLQVLSEYYRKFLFGNHPYGRPPSGDEKTVPTIQREEVVRFHEGTYVSSNMILIAVGDFKTGGMRQMFSDRFAGVSANSPEVKKYGKPDSGTTPRLLLVDKPDSTQTFFAIGCTGLSLSDPDRVVVNVVNTLFGGRFTSRLNTALRIDSGLSYGARSSFTPLRFPNEFGIFSFTKNESTEEALDAALKVLQSLHSEGLSQAELDSGKAYIIGQFGPTLETPAQLAARLAFFEIYGLDPKDEVDRYAAKLDAVTLADTRRVVARLFPKTNLVFAVIAKADEIGPRVKKYAETTQTVSISKDGFGE